MLRVTGSRLGVTENKSRQQCTITESLLKHYTHRQTNKDRQTQRNAETDW